MPGIAEMYSLQLLESSNSDSKPPRNLMKRIREEVEKEKHDEEELNLLNPDAQWATRYLSEEREKSQDSEPRVEVTERIQVTTLNIGTWKHIMCYDGTPRASFMMLVQTRQREACVIFLQEVHLQYRAEAWLKFKLHMGRLAPWIKVGKLVGPAGTCIMYSHNMLHVSEKIIHTEQNSIRLEIRQTNVKDKGSRTILYGVYFPFSKGKLHEILPTLKDFRECTMANSGNTIYVAGDFNAERHNKKAYTAELAKAHLKRVQTPVPTGIPNKARARNNELSDEEEASELLGGGRAQAIWTNVPESVKEVDVLTMYDDLSNHHRPVVFTIPRVRNECPAKPLNLFNEMRIIRPKHPLADEMNRATTYEELMETIEKGTVRKVQPVEYTLRRQKRDIAKNRNEADKE